MEYTVVAGSPLIIWIIRTGITKYYAFRVDTVAQRFETQQAERTKTIDKLKAATKYNSTQELLEKYGGEKPKAKPKKDSTNTPLKNPKNVQKPQPGRTSIGPPPTANIIRPGQIPSQPSTPQPVSKSPSTYIASPVSPVGMGQAEFAPNAFSAPPQYAQPGKFESGGHWYDRVLDLLLGEDEILPKNRIALICQNCRLVNGQAPPGTKTLAELGKWKCYGCGSVNGEEDEGEKVVQEIKGRIEETQEHPISPSEIKTVEAGEVLDGEALLSHTDANGDEVEDTIRAEGEESVSNTIEVKPGRGRPKAPRRKI